MTVESQRDLIGILGTAKNGFERALADGVTAACFTDPVCVAAFSAMIDLDKAKRVVDLQGVVSGVSADHRSDVLELLTNAPITKNYESILADVLDTAWQRVAYRRVQGLQKRLETRERNEPTDELRAEIANLSAELASGAKVKTKGFDQLSDETLAMVETRWEENKHGRRPGIPTGIKALDDAISGFDKGRLYIVGARTGIGKTTLAVNFSWAAVDAGHATAFFTVEMSEHEIAEKFLSRIGGIDGHRIVKGQLTSSDFDKIHAAARTAHSLPLYVVDHIGTSYEKFCLETRRLVRQHGVKLVVFDYLQQMTLGKAKGKTEANKHAELSIISHGLKQLARELGIAILCPAQLGRAAETYDFIPNKTHIKESGSIEHDADVIMLLHMTGPEELPDTKYLLVVDKNRRGPRTTIELKYNLATNYFGT